MNSEQRQPTRQTKDYEELGRSVAVNHAKTEIAKKEEHKNTNVLTNFLNTNWLQWVFHYIKSRFTSKHDFNTYEQETDKGIYPLQSKKGSQTISVALVSDWATDTVESKNISREIEKHAPDYTVHIGDTYFVGAPFEIESNFKRDDSFWHYGSVGSFALAGNHEMYSNGGPYFDILLPLMGLYYLERVVQKAGYFCLENEHWRIIGLDTGYRSVGIPLLEIFFSKADLRSEVATWLKDDLKIENDNRGLIFLAHHQYASSFDKTYPSAAKQIAKIISEHTKVLWFWGHEHRFAIYGKYKVSNGITAYGRCIGHGGMPVSLFDTNGRKKMKESNLVAYDNRYCKMVGKERVGHNGYAILKIEADKLEVGYYDEKDLLVKERWRYNKELKSIEGINIINHCTDLNLHQEISLAIKP
jgi:hypothetical protein